MILYKLLTYREEVCWDESHQHRTPVQQVAMVEVFGRKFEITLDGDRFNIRTEGFEDGLDLTFKEMLMFIAVVVWKERR